jgi:hypothetical protein
MRAMAISIMDVEVIVVGVSLQVSPHTTDTVIASKG